MMKKFTRITEGAFPRFLNFKLALVFLFALFFSVGGLKGQVANYTFSQSSGTYTAITGGTVLGSTSSGEQVFNNNTSGATGPVTSTGFPIGFNFTYNGTVYDKFAVATNGYIVLGTGSFTIANVLSGLLNSSTSGTFNSITPMQMDLVGQTGSEMMYLTSGVAPNRVLTVQWKGIKRYSSTYTSNLNFQIKLEETTNKVYIIYGSNTTSSGSSWNPLVGLKGASSSDFNSRTTTSNWSSTTASGSNTSNCTLSSTVFPASGQTYTWTPPSACPTPTAQPTAFTAGTNTSASVAGSFTPASGSPSGYLVVRSPGALSANPVDGTSYTAGNTIGNGTVVQSGSSTSFSASSLTSNTDYTITIFSYNSGSCLTKYYTTSPLTGVLRTCAAAPTGLSVSSPTTSGATFTWTSPAGGSAGAITSTLNIYSDSGYSSLVTSVSSVTSPYVLSSLNASTTYYYQVVNTNAGGCSTSANGGSFTTACAAISSLPWNEGFEGVTTATTAVGTSTGLPNCWNSQSTKWSSTNSTTYNTAHGGTKYIRYTWSSTNAYIWTPGFQLTAGVSYDFSFWAQDDGYATWVNDVYVNTSVSTTGATQLTPSYSPAGSGAYVRVLRTFVPSADGVYYFAIRGNQSSSTPNYMAFDDFKLDVTPPAITVTPANPNICTGGSVSLTASSTGSYTYAWSPSTGLSATSGATVTASPTVTTTYTVTGTNGAVSNTKTVTVTVNPIPATISITDTVSPVAADACTTDYVKLDVTGITPIYAINETFDSASPAVGWTKENYSSGGTTTNADWKIAASPYSAGSATETLSSAGTKFAISDSESQGSSSNYTETYLNMPVIDTRGFAGLSLSFDQYYRRYTSTDEATILISTDGTNWTSVASYTSTQGSASAFLNTTVNLDAYINQPTLYISFGYYSEWGYWWAIDNVKVFGNQTVTWTPVTGLYTNAGLSSVYTVGTNTTTVYAAPGGTQTYTAKSSLGAGGSCDKTASKSVTKDKYEFKGTGTDWSTASNWFPNVVPDATKCASIPAGKTVVIDINNAEAKSLSIAETGKLTINTGKSLTIADGINITNNVNNENFVLESGAVLLQTTTSSTANTGKVLARRSVTGINNDLNTAMDYVYWSSPVSGQRTNTSGTETGFSPGTPANRFYEYNENKDTFKATTDEYFVAGKGYAVRAETGPNPDDVPNNYVDGYGKTYKFIGVPNNGDIGIVLKRTQVAGAMTGTGLGFNMIGNPYPSNIDFRELYAANSSVIYNTAYFWTNNVFVKTQAGSGYGQNNYAVFNGTGGNSATTTPQAAGGTGDTTVPNGIVSVGQGFIVQAKNQNISDTPTSTNTLTFKNSYSTGHDLRVGTAGHFFQRQSTEGNNRFWVRLTSPANLVNTQLIGYVSGASNDFEQDYDAETLSTSSDVFYSVLGSRQLLIQGRAKNFSTSDVVPVGANFFQDGTYKIGLDAAEGIFGNGGQKVYLRDKLLGKTIDLSQGDYSFSVGKGLNNTRFEVVYKDDVVLGTDDLARSGFEVYRDGDAYVVRSTRKLGKVELYDVAGRLLRSIVSNETTAKVDMSDISNGVYVLKVENSGDTKTHKIIK